MSAPNMFVQEIQEQNEMLVDQARVSDKGEDAEEDEEEIIGEPRPKKRRTQLEESRHKEPEHNQVAQETLMELDPEEQQYFAQLSGPLKGPPTPSQPAISNSNDEEDANCDAEHPVQEEEEEEEAPEQEEPDSNATPTEFATNGVSVQTNCPQIGPLTKSLDNPRECCYGNVQKEIEKKH